jgi:hypothetical protein
LSSSPELYLQGNIKNKWLIPLTHSYVMISRQFVSDMWWTSGTGTDFSPRASVLPHYYHSSIASYSSLSFYHKHYSISVIESIAKQSNVKKNHRTLLLHSTANELSVVKMILKMSLVYWNLAGDVHVKATKEVKTVKWCIAVP